MTSNCDRSWGGGSSRPSTCDSVVLARSTCRATRAPVKYKVLFRAGIVANSLDYGPRIYDDVSASKATAIETFSAHGRKTIPSQVNCKRA